MRFEPAGTLLREQVNGRRLAAKDGAAAVEIPGLLEIVKAHVKVEKDRETALIALGHVLGVASMLAGLTDRE